MGRLKAGSKRAANPVGRASAAKRAVWGHSASAKAVLVIPLSSDPPSLDEGDEGEEEEPLTVETSPREPVVDR